VAIWFGLEWWFRTLLVYCDGGLIYKTSECGKQLPNKAICDGQIAIPSILRMDIQCVRGKP
jgi:hypothetical protein